MRILVLSTDYPRFISKLYRQNPGLEVLSFDEQSRVRENTLFGAETFYGQNFEALGHQVLVLHPNNFFLQAAWAREHGIAVLEPTPQRSNDSGAMMWLKRRLRRYKSLFGGLALKFGGIAPLSQFERDVLLAQIEEFRPDIILNQTIQTIDSSIIATARKSGRFMIAQIGVDPPPGLDTSVYDLGISQIPWVVEYFRKQGLRAEPHHLGFEPTILARLGEAPQKDVDVSFVGGLSAAHGDRIAFLEAIAREFRLNIWVPSLAGISAKSPLQECVRGEVYGREMYDVLRRSRITLNSHINVARGSAGNMRLFEATGSGTFLLTDNLYDLPTLFAPGNEVGAYDNKSDCLEKIRTYLRDEGERETIAAAGQRRTLSEHTYRMRAEEILRFVGQYGN